MDTADPRGLHTGVHQYVMTGVAGRGGVVSRLIPYARADAALWCHRDDRAPSPWTRSCCASVMTYLIPFFILVAGLAIPVQVAANNRLREAVHSPVLAVCIAFVVGASVLALAAWPSLLGRGRLMPGLIDMPWWGWIGGGLSAFAVFASVVGFEHGGAALVTALTVFGQLTMAVLLDHFAWLGAHHTPINRWRIAGVALLSIGAVLVQRK
jgi:transporter family-2 protein